MTRAERPPTIKEVARHAGVALSSVSRVLNAHPDVSAKMRERVLAAVNELGYEPDLLASGLRSGQTKTIGILVPDVTNPLFATVFAGAEEHLRNKGYSVLLAHSNGEAGRDVEAIRLLRRRRVDGLIVSVADEGSERTLEELAALDIPVVLLDRELEGLPHASVVVADHRTGVRRATEHLLDLGHREIALITGPQATRPGRERALGFTDAHERRGLGFSPEAIHHGDFSADFGNRRVKQLMHNAPPPSAIIAGGNLVLLGVVAALSRYSLSVGRDIALIACDDVPLAEFYAPPITVVSRDMSAMGRVAAVLLLDLADGRETRTETVSTELIVRESVFRMR